MDMRDLDPHMIRWWFGFGFGSGTGSTRCCGFGLSTGSTRRLWYAERGTLYARRWIVGLHSFNTCLMLLSPNVFSLLAVTQIIPCVSLLLI